MIQITRKARAVAGDLKLAYSQFEGLETFARFGARLDEDSRKVIEHGRRIRVCLKQPEFAPVSITAQISLLSALTADLFDAVPHNRMKNAGKSGRQSADEIPTEVRERLDTADKLSDQDHETIIDMARQALARSQPKPEPAAKSWSIPKLGRGWEIDGGGDLPHVFGD